MRLADTLQGNRGSGRQMRRFTRQVASGNTSRERLRKKPGAAGRQLHRVPYHEPDDSRPVAGATQGDCSPHDGDPIRGLIVMPDGFMNVHRAEIVSLAARYHLPVVTFGLPRPMPSASWEVPSRPTFQSRPRSSFNW